MPSYTITEPHPTVSQNEYTHTGRGGAGNTFRAPRTTPAAGVPTAASSSSSPPVSTTKSSSRYYSGRGGAGNAHKSAPKPTMSFDEEYARADLRARQSAVGHVGRGGAGNVFGGGPNKTPAFSPLAPRKLSDAGSCDSRGSGRSGFWGRVSGSFHR